MAVLAVNGSAKSGLLGATALALLSLAPGHALAQGPGATDVAPDIIIRDDLSPDLPPPDGILDSGVTGVGQIASRPDPNTTGLGVCTGTLINPRTVIFAAHCVNDQAAKSYGAASGGTPISVGFGASNRAGLLSWLGLTGARNQTNAAEHIYNIEQIWYDERSLATGFLEADVAMGTLDTPAFDVPTWTMLFTPLAQQTHAKIVGYGTKGTSADPAQGIDFRRRAAENMLSVLGSLDDRDLFLFGEESGLPQSLYMMDFDSPAGQDSFDPDNGKFDFDIFDGPALPKEGITAGGDSGGPLIVDRKFNKSVVVGVLSGGSRFFADQKFSTYGTHSFYQPLFLFWDKIVANNSYVYATNRKESGNWTDPNYWVQTMDPNYAIEVNGKLVNALPGNPALGVSGDTVKFGKICFLDDCVNLADISVPPGNGKPNSIQIPGGPGSTKFVPNNIVADPTKGIRARYYDVTLKGRGETVLGAKVTIDRMTLDRGHMLNIKPGARLGVIGDYTQISGWTQVDGQLVTGEALITEGILSGAGRIDPTYLTVVAGAVLPGTVGGAGTMTIAGDVILSSGALTIFDVSRPRTDRIDVVGDADNDGIIALAGTAAFTKATKGAAPRQGDSFTIVTAQGGVDGRFDTVLGGIGVLKPELAYSAHDVTLTLRAGKFTEFLGGYDPTTMAFANALDKLRGGSYANLYGLYGAIDVMEPNMLAATFSNLVPRAADEAAMMDSEQGGKVTRLVSDRLSMLGTRAAGYGRLSVVGAPEMIGMDGQSLSGSSAAQISFARNMVPTGRSMGALPENVSGFIAGGVERGQALAAAGNGARDSWHIAMGLEFALDDALTIGSAFGHVDGISRFGGSEASAVTNQAAFYGSYRLGGGLYAGGLAAVSHTRIGMDRSAGAGTLTSRMAGDTKALSIDMQAELGANIETGLGLMLTPRAQIAYKSYNLSDFRERGGEMAMMIDDMRLNRIESRLGVRMSGTIGNKRGWQFTPELRADWVNALASGRNSFDVRFAAAPDVAIALPLMGRDTSWGEVKGGFRLVNGPIAFGAGIERNIARSDLTDERAVVDFAFRF